MSKKSHSTDKASKNNQFQDVTTDCRNSQTSNSTASTRNKKGASNCRNQNTYQNSSDNCTKY